MLENVERHCGCGTPPQKLSAVGAVFCGSGLVLASPGIVPCTTGVGLNATE